MKDQKKLLTKCLTEDIPAIVFQGTDKCSVEILQAAVDIYKKNGCSEEFLYDFNQVIANFKGYQAENTNEIKVPALTNPEIEVVRMDMQSASLKKGVLPLEIRDLQNKFESYGMTETTEEIISDSKYVIVQEKDVSGIVGKHGDYEFAINYNTSDNQAHFFIFSNDPKYPERVPDYESLKACLADIVHNSSKNIDLSAVTKQILNRKNQITEIEIYSLESGGFAINCEIGGVRQLPQKMTKEDLLTFSDQTDRKELANKYFGEKSFQSDPEKYLGRERNQILREYAANPFGDISLENISELGMEKYAAIFKKYMEMKSDMAVNERILSSGCKTLIADIDRISDKEPQLTNFRILDKSTDKIEPFQTNNINISKQSPETVKQILSGGKANTSTGLVQLSKTPTGWGLTIVKQAFNVADSSSGI